MVGRYLAAFSVLYAACKSGFHLILLQEWSGDCDIPDFPFDPDIQDSGEYDFPFKVLFYTTAIVAVCAMVLLQLRTYALYNKSKLILGLFGVLNMIAIIFFVIELTAFKGLQEDPRYIDAIFGNEYFGSGTNYSPLFWLPFMLNEMVTFILVVIRYWKIHRHIRAPGTKNNTSLSNIIVRDNIIYFSVIFFVYLFGLLLLVNYELLFSLANTHLLASVAISGILAPNLFLSLKKGFYTQGQSTQVGTDATMFHATVPSTVGSRFSTVTT
ncbi:uncharacterized protein FOMMEDRAFT_30626 [Fomitiporia mediterranea MF3/22]|uniref:uncharacterized protein n=1 Tax=Fomitiporia mediterranea (strain MF3/22) TaxID=694068 RepID=UPI0004409B1C|nr:uncharacterized protein FOMMEDRAFT_30626 [Fomitiporia mediterranea MF3/22]EJD00659.1 hypothetical protein FOMMEDRAFT_30626 [Fomitiporia mediterranea MF3/22]